MTTASTRSRIISTAEALFAERGISATSLRAITAKAEVNIAAIHYHFGSREELVRQVFYRRLDPINKNRLSLLETATRNAAPNAPTVEAILHAFLKPALDMLSQPEKLADFRALMARIHAETPAIRQICFAFFTEVSKKFMNAFSTALPKLDQHELYMRYKFTIGAMTMSLLLDDQLPEFPGMQSCQTECDLQLAHLVSFLAAGFRADAPKPENNGNQ